MRDNEKSVVVRNSSEPLGPHTSIIHEVGGMKWDDMRRMEGMRKQDREGSIPM